MIVPFFGLLMPFAMSCLKISTPLTSSPCIPAVNNTTGPGFLDRLIMTGTSTRVRVCNFATWKLISLDSPAETASPKICSTELC